MDQECQCRASLQNRSPCLGVFSDPALKVGVILFHGGQELGSFVQVVLTCRHEGCKSEGDCGLVLRLQEAEEARQHAAEQDSMKRS